MTKWIATIFLLAVCSVAAQTSDNIDLKNITATFTNRQNVTYTNVTLSQANMDGVIYMCDSGGGLISYTNLSPDLLEQWGIPTNRIQMAEERAGEKAERDKEYWQSRYAQQQALAAQLAKQRAADAAAQQAAATAAQTTKPAHKSGKSKSGQNNSNNGGGGS